MLKTFLYNPFKNFKKREWVLWIASILVAGGSNLVVPDATPLSVIAPLVGVTAVVMISRGDVWGQILAVIFCFMYAVEAYDFRYYGEMMTYLGMAMPIAALSVYTWVKNPYEEAEHEVAINILSVRTKILCAVLTVSITVIFYFVLGALDTPNLGISTFSVGTSFIAAFLLMLRSTYYVLAYAINDFTLVGMWILASMVDLAYLPMVFTFLTFGINDTYGFFSWKLREKEQFHE